MKSILQLMVFNLFFLCVTTTSAQPTPESILTTMKQISGGDHWDKLRSRRDVFQINIGGLNGQLVVIRDLSDGRVASFIDAGPIKQSEGFDGQNLWYEEGNQVSINNAPDAMKSHLTDRYFSTLAYWFRNRMASKVELLENQFIEGQQYFVLRIIPENGYESHLWVDSESYLPYKLSQFKPNETQSIWFDDFRENQGFMLPFKQKIGNGNESYDIHLQLLEWQPNPQNVNQRLTIPSSEKIDYFAGQKNRSETFSIQLYNNHIYITAKLNDTPVTLLVDTGGANIVTPTAAKKLGLNVEGKVEGRGVGEKTADVRFTTIKSLQLGNIELTDQLFYVFDMEEIQKVEGVQFEGLIGYEVFKRFVVGINYQDNLLTLTDPEHFHYAGKGSVIPFTFHDRTPQIEAELDGIKGAFTIDTGSRATVSIHGPFAKNHQLNQKYDYSPEMTFGWGVGGPVKSTLARVGAFRIGDLVVKEPLFDFFKGHKGAFSNADIAGNIGGGLLRRFNVTFNYKKQHIIFEPNHHFSEREEFDMSGMWLLDDGEYFTVNDLLAGGAAELAGLKVGDKIHAVNGINTKDLILSDVRSQFKNNEENSDISLKVQHGTQFQLVTLKLKPII